jgi:hypothetical protein
MTIYFNVHTVAIVAHFCGHLIDVILSVCVSADEDENTPTDQFS